MNPEEMYAIIQWLMSTQGQNGLTMNDIPVPFVPIDDEPFADQEYLNKRLTMENKATGLMMDPEFIARLGPTAGGPSPESFAPNVSYELVGTPAVERLSVAQNSGDPVSEIMASVFLRGGTQYEAETAVMNELTDPESLYYDVLNSTPGLMQTNDFTGEPEINIDRISAAAGEMAKYVADDPYFQPNTSGDPSLDGVSLDPGFTDGAVSNDGGQLVRGQDGNFYRRTEEQSPMAQLFAEAGLENPYGTYDPDSIASRDTIDKENKTYRDLEQSYVNLGDASSEAARMDFTGGQVNPLRQFQEVLASVQGRGKTDMPAPINPDAFQQSQVAVPQVGRASEMDPVGTGPNQDYLQALAGGPQMSSGAGIAALARGTTNDQPRWQEIGGRTQNSPAMQQQYINMILRGNADDRVSTSRANQRHAQRENMYAQFAAEKAYAARLAREKQVREMAQRGQSPWHDQQRALRANIYGSAGALPVGSPSGATGMTFGWTFG